MEKIFCKKCKKKIEGYNQDHVNFLMKQHMMKHENEERRKKLKKKR